ncbi:hypothetical protein MKW94_026664 [Papaver nudicaule]|uniref:Uncharacterized protein n=1 Tax=Papaver nudicaule TaxID=74823 RepID=A0AA42AVL4_PAPNU|nr:hypothetical protein [Papaver nudicaule]
MHKQKKVLRRENGPLKNISWPDLIHNNLQKELDVNMGAEMCKNTTGCVTYLLLWFAEHTHLIKPENVVTDPEGEYVPRAARWNLMSVCEAILKDFDTIDIEVKVGAEFKFCC